MSKWIKFKDTHFNLSQIQQIYKQDCKVLIDGIPIAECETEEKAEEYIKDFIAEHYVPTEKVS